MIEISFLLTLGIISGILQVVGYWVYLRDDEIDPNPVSWFMFAYGTAILAVLEWDKEATVPELILPVVCAVLSIAVSVRCWKKARLKDPTKWWPEDWWPEDFWERWSFISDIIITVAYIAAWALTFAAFMNEETRQTAAYLFLLLSNLSTFPSFYPIIKSTYINPSSEHWLPWFIWTIAYVMLGYITYHTHNDVLSILMLYPVSCAIMHGMVSVLALRKRN